MLNIEFENIKCEDLTYVHSLMLTLKHYKLMSSYLSLKFDSDKYYVYSQYNFYAFDDIYSACIYLLNVISAGLENKKEVVEYFKRILGIQFNEYDALDYIQYYVGGKGLQRLK